MKRLLLLSILACFFQYGLCDSQPKENGRELRAASDRSTVPPGSQLRAPARSDILLVIEETGVTICFNGDFGPGYYQLTDNVSGNVVSGPVVAEAGSTEYVPFPVSETTSFDFYIEFEDGSWSHLTWGN